MPTYEYRCPAGHEFEVIQKITDRSRAKCPTCGRPAERQMSGGAGLIFKGSGFYITDYGKDGKGPRKESDADSGKAETPKSEPAPSAKEDSTPKPEAAKPAKKKAKPSE